MKGYLGIDVSKGYADFALLNEEKRLLEKTFQLDDTRAGHDKLKDQLTGWIERHRITHLYCGLESTGGFENNWYGSLGEWKRNLPISVARLNPAGVKKNSQAGLKRNVTDALSAQYIAEYLIVHPESVNYDPQNVTYSSYRSLHKHIFLQRKQKTQLINQLKAALYSAFPELMRYCKDSIPGWVLKVLEKYPSAEKVSKVKVAQLCKINHVDVAKAEFLIAKAKNTIAFQRSGATEFLIKTLASEILQKQAHIEESKAVLQRECLGPEVTLLTTITGIGEYSASAIMIEIESIRRFSSSKHLVSYFGVHPELKESGDKKLMARMSKKGRSSMRAILFMCAKTAVVYDPHLKSIYHGHRQEGKTHKQAIGVIMHKLLRIIWGVLSSGTEYDSSIDKKNQIERSTTVEADSHKELKSKRRYQDLDSDAPVSNKQAKKRKVYAESQASESRSNTGSSTHT